MKLGRIIKMATLRDCYVVALSVNEKQVKETYEKTAGHTPQGKVIRPIKVAR